MSTAAKRPQSDAGTPPDSPTDTAYRKKVAAAAARASSPSKTKASTKNNKNFDDFRKYLLTQVAAGTPVIRKLQEYRSRPLDWFFIIWSFLGDRFLYIYSLPWCVFRTDLTENTLHHFGFASFVPCNQI
jgi:hypothetical protein